MIAQITVCESCNQRTPSSSGMHSPPSSPPPLAPRDAARVGLCASVPSRFAQSPKRCSALVPGCPPCCDRRASGSLPRIERHESGAAGLRAARPPSAQPRIASMSPALPRRPKQTRAMLILFYAADAPPPPPARLAPYTQTAQYQFFFTWSRSRRRLPFLLRPETPPSKVPACSHLCCVRECHSVSAAAHRDACPPPFHFRRQ